MNKKIKKYGWIQKKIKFTQKSIFSYTSQHFTAKFYCYG